MCLLLGMYLFNNNNSFFEQRELLQQYNIGFEPIWRNLFKTVSTVVGKFKFNDEMENCCTVATQSTS